MYQLNMREYSSPFSKVMLQYVLEIIGKVSSRDMNHKHLQPKKVLTWINI